MSERMKQMQIVLNRLVSDYQMAWNNPPVAISSVSLPWKEQISSLYYLLTGSTLVISSDVEEAYQRTLEVIGKSLALLDGSDSSAKYGNLWDAAQRDESAFVLWYDLASESANSLQTANKLINNWSVSDFLSAVSADVIATVTPSQTSLGLVAVILLAVVAIMVLK